MVWPQGTTPGAATKPNSSTKGISKPYRKSPNERFKQVENSIPVALTATSGGHTVTVAWHRVWIGPHIGGSEGGGEVTLPNGEKLRWVRDMWYSENAGEDEITFYPPIGDLEAYDEAYEAVIRLVGEVGNAQAEASMKAIQAVCPTDAPEAVTA